MNFAGVCPSATEAPSAPSALTAKAASRMTLSLRDHMNSLPLIVRRRKAGREWFRGAGGDQSTNASRLPPCGSTVPPRQPRYPRKAPLTDNSRARTRASAGTTATQPRRFFPLPLPFPLPFLPLQPFFSSGRKSGLAVVGAELDRGAVGRACRCCGC